MKYLRLFENFDDLSSRESQTRTKPLSEEELLGILKENCKQFSFSNDQLWRRSNDIGGYYNNKDLGIFFSAERKRTIGSYNYKDFFDLRKDYPVPRYKSLIGSTTKKGADYFGSGNKSYLIIPFDDSQIVFAGSPDLALWSRVEQEFTDDLFLMKTYSKNFKVPVEKLDSIRNLSKLSSWSGKLPELGFEFFTTSPCLLIHESKIDWLKDNLSVKANS
jgi:hypothetical protein